MQAISYSEARENLKSVIDRVVADHTPIAITRQRGEGAVLVSESDWAVFAPVAGKRRATAGSGSGP